MFTYHSQYYHPAAESFVTDGSHRDSCSLNVCDSIPHTIGSSFRLAQIMGGLLPFFKNISLLVEVNDLSSRSASAAK